MSMIIVRLWGSSSEIRFSWLVPEYVNGLSSRFSFVTSRKPILLFAYLRSVQKWKTPQMQRTSQVGRTRSLPLRGWVGSARVGALDKPLSIKYESISNISLYVCIKTQPERALWREIFDTPLVRLSQAEQHLLGWLGGLE